MLATLYLEVKWPWRDFDHSSSSAKVKNAGSCTFTAAEACMLCMVVTSSVWVMCEFLVGGKPGGIGGWECCVCEMAGAEYW